jgi:hypothetical protein
MVWLGWAGGLSAKWQTTTGQLISRPTNQLGLPFLPSQ